MQVIYLHGFASSPQSSKARSYAAHLAEHAVPVRIPDLNQPAFETLTVTRMLEQTLSAMAEASASGEPVVLVGSSLGAFVAVHAAARARIGQSSVRVTSLILLAPALDFSSSRMRDLGQEALDQWRTTDRIDVFHYGYGRTMPLRYALYEDAAQYDALALDLSVPILIFQGTRDTIVNPDVAVRFARSRPNVTLRLVDDDHQLLASMPRIWEESREFLGLPSPPDCSFAKA